MLPATMMWVEFYIQEVAASECSLFSGDENGDLVLCAFNRIGGGSCDSGKGSHSRLCGIFLSVLYSAHLFTWLAGSTVLCFPFSFFK